MSENAGQSGDEGLNIEQKNERSEYSVQYEGPRNTSHGDIRGLSEAKAPCALGRRHDNGGFGGRSPPTNLRGSAATGR